MTYNFRDHVCVKFDIALTVPIHVQVELDAIVKGLGDLDIGQHNRCGTQLDLGEVQACQWPWKHGLEHWLHDILDHLAPSCVNVGP